MFKIPILLKPRILTVKNTLFKGNNKYGFIILIALVFIAIPYSSWKIMSSISSEVISEPLMFSVLEIIFITFFTLQLLASCLQALHSLFLSSDTELFLVSPITKSRIFISKFTENLVASSWILLILFLPIIWTITASVVQTNFGFYFLLVSLLITGIIIISAIGFSATVLFAKIYPIRSLKEFLLISTLILAIFIHHYSQSLGFLKINVSSSVNSLNQDFSFTNWKNKITSKGKGILLAPLKEEITPLAKKTKLEFLSLLLVVGTLSVLASYRIFIDFYSPLEVSEKLGQVNKQRKKSWINCKNFKFLSFLQKDLHLFLRDLAQPVQLVLFLAIGGITLLSLKQTEQIRATLGANEFIWEGFIVTIAILSHLLFTILFCGRFIFPALLLEDEANWLLKSSPLSRLEFITYKFLSQFALTLFILIPIFFAIAFALNLSLASIYFAVVVCFFHILSITACALASGGAIPLFKFEHLGHVSGGVGNFLFMLISMLLIPLMQLVSLGISVFTTSNLNISNTLNDQIFFCIIYGFLSVAISRMFLVWAAKKWD